MRKFASYTGAHQGLAVVGLKILLALSLSGKSQGHLSTLLPLAPVPLFFHPFFCCPKLGASVPPPASLLLACSLRCHLYSLRGRAHCLPSAGPTCIFSPQKNGAGFF